jgi:hypothetical protein
MYSHDSSGTHFRVRPTWNGILPDETDDLSENSDDQAAEETAFSEELKKLWAMEMEGLDDDEKE